MLFSKEFMKDVGCWVLFTHMGVYYIGTVLHLWYMYYWKAVNIHPLLI